jgi:hypothetical protein
MPYIEDSIRELIELEKEQTFTQEQLKEWIHLLKNRKENEDWDIPCPCDTFDISTGTAECPELAVIIEDYKEDMEANPHEIGSYVNEHEGWACDVDYCSCKCRRSYFYQNIKDELSELIEDLDLKEEFHEWLGEFILELENLIK